MIRRYFLFAEHFCYQNINAGIPSVLNAASRAIASASVDECEIAPCFLQNQIIGTQVFGPTIANTAPDVDLESCRSPANEASTNK